MKLFRPTSNHGSIAIRFSYQGQPYSLSGLGAWKNSAALHRANAISHQIYLDCLAGKFAGDPTIYLGEQVKIPKRKKKLRFIEVWDLWVNSLDLADHTKQNHYERVRVFLTKALKETDKYIVEQFIASRELLAASIWNKRRSMLKSCYEWAINEGYFDAPNPFAQLRASTKKSEYKVNPFTKNEVKMILDEIKNCCPHYLPFITFLFSTGCRTGEAVGLKWDYVNWEKCTITIAESLSKRGSGRVQKRTKTESVTILPLTDSLYELLEDVWYSREREKRNGYVFLSPTGKVINPDNFRERIWKPILAALGLEYRTLYQTRHTVLSQVANDQGLLAAAAVAGHRDATMVTKHYARFQGEIKLPELI